MKLQSIDHTFYTKYKAQKFSTGELVYCGFSNIRLPITRVGDQQIIEHRWLYNMADLCNQIYGEHKFGLYSLTVLGSN